MKDLMTQDLTENIIIGLLSGESPELLQKRHTCDLSVIYSVMSSSVFSERIKECLNRDIQVSGLIALKNIKKIASEDGISKATQLKANQWIAEKALELNRLGNEADSPATMTQDQLARRLKDLQKEAIKRAIPIDTGIIETTVEDML